jgi:hypothetical protein
MRRHFAALLAFLSLGGCTPSGSAPDPAPLRASAPTATDWRTLVGCYRVEHLRFVLDTVPVTTGWRGRESARQARSLPLTERTGNRFWLITPRNALEVVFEDGLFATRLEMVVRGDSLVGNRHVYGDVPSSPPTVRPAAGVREPCPAGVAAAAP